VRPGTVGRPLPGVQVRIEDGGLLSARVEVLGPHWITTTDLASIDDDGIVSIHGRSDGAINRGGFKILPDDVRVALEGHPTVLAAAVVGRPDARLGEVPVAIVELCGPATPSELVEHLRTRLAPYEIPARIDVVDEVPRTPSGKADLTAVRRHFTDPASADER